MIFLCFSFCLSHGQENNNLWEAFKAADELKIETKTSDCHLDNAFHQQWKLFRMKNTTSRVLKVSYHLDLYYNNECSTCNSVEYEYTFELQPHQTLGGECSLESPQGLHAFVRFLDMDNRSVLTHVEWSNLKIEKR